MSFESAKQTTHSDSQHAIHTIPRLDAIAIALIIVVALSTRMLGPSLAFRAIAASILLLGSATSFRLGSQFFIRQSVSRSSVHMSAGLRDDLRNIAIIGKHFN